jgi:hypothetical protein
MIHNLANCFSSTETEINQTLKVDLEKNFSRFSFVDHYPDKKGEIDQIFKMAIVNIQGDAVSVSSLLEAPELDDEHLDLFSRLGFTQLSSHPEIGIILEHPKFPGWLIKKNYGFQKEEGYSKRILKVVKGSDFPFWMLPLHLRKFSERNSISIQVPNDIINSLRPVVLRRGRKLTKRLGLDHIRAAKEYLCLLPTANPTKPLYKRVVVISQKENVLSQSNNLWHYVKLANLYPDKLRRIASQIALFIRHVKITDSHLNNFPFLDDDSDTALAIDGEPVGGLADASLPDMVQAVEAFDPGFYSLLGLKKLQSSIYEQMHAEGIKLKDILKVQSIFDEVINSNITSVIQERAWQLVKARVYASSIMMNVAFFFVRSLYTFYCQPQFLNRKSNQRYIK